MIRLGEEICPIWISAAVVSGLRPTVSADLLRRPSRDATQLFSTLLPISLVKNLSWSG